MSGFGQTVLLQVVQVGLGPSRSAAGRAPPRHPQPWGY